MPFIPHTPEALLPRTDSKNPATTCKGITSSGRPCRRGLASRSVRRGSHAHGVLAVAPVDAQRSGDNGPQSQDDAPAAPEPIEAAAFFCWQHQDQAEQLRATAIKSSPNQHATTTTTTTVFPLKQRSSIDTLIERVGIIEISDHDSPKPTKVNIADPHRGRRNHHRVPGHGNGGSGGRCPASRHVIRQPTWEGVQGPLMSVPEEAMRTSGGAPITQQPTMHRRPVPTRAPNRDLDNQGLLSPPTTFRPVASSSASMFLCCFGAPDPSLRDDGRDIAAVRRRAPRHSDATTSATRPEMTIRRPGAAVAATHTSRPRIDSPLGISSPPAHSITPPQSLSPRSFVPHELLTLIPSSVSTTTLADLAAELAKPISATDEPGYIYLFCHKSDESSRSPDRGGGGGAPLLPAPSSLLDAAPASPSVKTRKESEELLRHFSTRHRPRRLSDNHCRNEAEEQEQQQHQQQQQQDAEDAPILFLKIGRATNVHRRLSQWQRQCGPAPFLLRSYPHFPPSSSSSSSSAAHANHTDPADQEDHALKVPHSKRVERLIHIELGGQRVRRECGGCGRRHVEWFAVEGTREGVARVDEVVRRWVGWSLGRA